MSTEAKGMEALANEQEERFCQEYLIDLNATQAMMRAVGNSIKLTSAATMGHRLLRKVEIQQRITFLNDRRKERVKASADEVLVELSRIALADLGDMFDDDGLLLPLKAMPLDARRAIASLETEELFSGFMSVCKECGKDRELHMGYIKKLKIWDKNKSLENLGRHHKLFTDKLEVKDKTDRAAAVKRARERLAQLKQQSKK